MFLSTFVICRLFDDSHFDKCEVTPHCDFDFHFSGLISNVEHIFMCLLAFFGKMSTQVFCPFFIWVVWVFLILSYISCLYILGTDKPLISHIICKYFLPFSKLSLHFVSGFLCCAKAFKFNYVLFIYFMLLFLLP